MADRNEIVKLAVDLYHGNVKDYSTQDANDVLREALIEANGGSTKFDPRAMRDGKYNGLFSLVETILNETTSESLADHPILEGLVETRNVPMGDKNEFEIHNDDLFEVAEIADGTLGLRRQRFDGHRKVSIPTTWKGVRIYEEMSRLLAGQVDFAEMVERVTKSFNKKLLDEVMAVFQGIGSQLISGVTYFPAVGSYSENTLLDLIAHVEAQAEGKNAIILGTKKALRNLAPSVEGADSKSDLYNQGYYGKFYGSTVIALPQRHISGTNNFLLADDVITVLAGEEAPIKLVYEGDPFVLTKEPQENADLTQEFYYMHKYGLSVLMSNTAGIGRYEFQ